MVGVSRRFFYYRFTDFGTNERFTYNRALVKKTRKSGKLSKGRIVKTSQKHRTGRMKDTTNFYEAINNTIPSVINYINDNYLRLTESRLKALARKKSR
jgi:hypothetical protein